MEIFENVAYIMAYHADNTIPDNIDDWLDQFEMFSIYEVLPEILALWGTNLPRLGLSDHWYGNGYLDGERKRFCKI